MVAYARLKAKVKFKLLALKAVAGRLQEITNMVISLGNFWYFEKTSRSLEMVATGGSNVPVV